MSEPSRCWWAGPQPIYIAYHDEEWGVPSADDRLMLEKLVLEGFQAGLSWITVLNKRARFREVFDNFDAEKIARYDDKKIESLLTDTGIIRHRGKIEATISNARAYLKLREQKTLAAFLWDFVDGAPVQNAFAQMKDIPGQTDVSRSMAKTLKAKGFRFCGPTTVYAFMQSLGMVNDHLVGCHRHDTCAELAGAFKAPKG
ncbi:MAG TPA: DNA-3-methyladenine glycosylase I [Rhizobiales bacterium]|nr:DNA-3-methyladenine glycosylase 1 [bacterium BMS3Bbin10]HDO51532.1 DNA-3-methyladenine glycosylase I [Hyphomicrobiales bacterium]